MLPSLASAWRVGEIVCVQGELKDFVTFSGVSFAEVTHHLLGSALVSIICFLLWSPLTSCELLITTYCILIPNFKHANARVLLLASTVWTRGIKFSLLGLMKRYWKWDCLRIGAWHQSRKGGFDFQVSGSLFLKLMNWKPWLDNYLKLFANTFQRLESQDIM